MCNDSNGLPPECICNPSYWRREWLGQILLWNAIPRQTRSDYKLIIDKARVDKIAARSEATQSFVVDCLERLRSPATLIGFWTALKAQSIWTIKSVLDAYDGADMVARFTLGPAFKTDVPVRSGLVMVALSQTLNLSERLEESNGAGIEVDKDKLVRTAI